MARKIPFARDTGLHLSSTGGFSETKLGLVERRASLRQRSDLMRSSFKEENVRRMIRRAGIEMHAHGKADLISAVRSLLDHLSFELLKKSVILAEGASRQTLPLRNNLRSEQHHPGQKYEVTTLEMRMKPPPRLMSFAIVRRRMGLIKRKHCSHLGASIRCPQGGDLFWLKCSEEKREEIQ